MKEITNTDYDLSYIKDIGEGDSFLLMLINLFLSSSKEDLASFKKAVISEDWSEVGSVAHRMRSRAQHFKMTKLVKMLQEIEIRCIEFKITGDFLTLTNNMEVYYLELIGLLTQESLNLNNSKG